MNTTALLKKAISGGLLTILVVMFFNHASEGAFLSAIGDAGLALVMLGLYLHTEVFERE